MSNETPSVPSYAEFRGWVDATYPDGNVTSGRFDDDAMQDAFEAGYKTAEVDRTGDCDCTCANCSGCTGQL